MSHQHHLTVVRPDLIECSCGESFGRREHDLANVLRWIITLLRHEDRGDDWPEFGWPELTAAIDEASALLNPSTVAEGTEVGSLGSRSAPVLPGTVGDPQPTGGAALSVRPLGCDAGGPTLSESTGPETLQSPEPAFRADDTAQIGR